MPAPTLLELTDTYAKLQDDQGRVTYMARKNYDALVGATPEPTPIADRQAAPPPEAPPEALKPEPTPPPAPPVTEAPPAPQLDSVTSGIESGSLSEALTKGNRVGTVDTKSLAPALGTSITKELAPPPAPVPDIVPEVAPAAPAPVAPAPVAPPVEDKKVTGKTSTKQDYNRSIREYGDSAAEIARKNQEIDQRDADAILAEKQRSDAELARLEAERVKREKEIQEEARANYDAQKQRIDDYVNADVDQGRWWAEKSTASKIVAGISVALSGFGMALKGQGGANPAMDIINGAIDKDLNIQMEKIGRLKEGFAMGESLLGDFWKMVGNEKEAFNAAKTVALESTLRKLNIIAAQTTSEKVKTNAEALILKIRKEQATLLEDSRQNAVKEAQINYSNRTTRMGAELQREQFEWQKKQAEQEAANAAAANAKYFNTETVVGVVDGRGNPIVLKDPKDRENARDITGVTQEMINSARRIRYILTEEGRVASGYSKDQAKAEAARLATAMLASAKGVPSDEDKVLYLSQIGFDTSDPTKVFVLDRVDTRIANVDGFIESTLRSANTKLKTALGGLEVEFEEFDPIDQSKSDKPTAEEEAVSAYVSKQRSQAANADKSMDNTPEAKARRQKEDIQRNEDYLRISRAAWKEIDAAYGTPNDKAVASRKRAIMESLLRESAGDPQVSAAIQADIAKIDAYIQDPSSRREEVIREQNREAARKQAERKKRTDEAAAQSIR